MSRGKSGLFVLLVLVNASCWDGHNNFNFDAAPVSSMGEGYYQYGATIDGEVTWWKVPFAEVQRTPDWSPESEPPLSASQAVQIGQREVPKYTDTPGAYRLDKVELLNVTNCCPTKKWIYLVSFERDREYQARKFTDRGTITIPILLDGRVIQGTKDKPAA